MAYLPVFVQRITSIACEVSLKFHKVDRPLTTSTDTDAQWHTHRTQQRKRCKVQRGTADPEAMSKQKYKQDNQE